MYAKNRIQCATGKLNEPNVCEKVNTMCCRQAEGAKCMRKTEYNVPTVGKRAKYMRKSEYKVPMVGKRAKCMRKSEYNVPPVT